VVRGTAKIAEINAKYDAKLMPVPGQAQVMDSIAVARRETRQMVENLPEPVRDGARWMNDSFRDLAKRGLHISMFTQDLVD
jgi:nicotinic acid phosphoribosyltransferase